MMKMTTTKIIIYNSKVMIMTIADYNNASDNNSNDNDENSDNGQRR